jgi:hypothetical protein
MTAFDWIGHAVLFFLSGFTYWLMRAGRQDLGTILTIALPVASVYFLGWWSLLTFVVGVFFAAQMFAKAIHAGKDPFSNPWQQPPDAN